MERKIFKKRILNKTTTPMLLFQMRKYELFALNNRSYYQNIA